MEDLPKLIRDAMDAKDLGVREVARDAEARGLKLSSSIVSTYRRGILPRRIDDATLEAFSVVLNIPLRKLRAAAGRPEDEEARATLGESIDSLGPGQQRIVRQIIHEFARLNHGGQNDERIILQEPTPLYPVETPDRPDALEEQKIAARNQPDPNISMTDEPADGP